MASRFFQCVCGAIATRQPGSRAIECRCGRSLMVGYLGEEWGKYMINQSHNSAGIYESTIPAEKLNKVGRVQIAPDGEVTYPK